MQVGPQGKSVGIEHVPELVRSSENNMRKSDTGRHLLDESQVLFVVGDGRLGYPVSPHIFHPSNLVCIYRDMEHGISKKNAIRNKKHTTLYKESGCNQACEP